MALALDADSFTEPADTNDEQAKCLQEGPRSLTYDLTDLKSLSNRLELVKGTS